MKLIELVNSEPKLKLKADKMMHGFDKGIRKGKVIYVSPYAHALLSSKDAIMAPSIMNHMEIT